ncbi:related to P.glauca late embryogenesis abundant protein and YBR177c and YPL095c [Rhynchosporium graminicola]|uniref:alcohol O-acetyltransferase n=1 Tax=Rhynchosporium graminicola TaxID=2792576 RepID=A0A1E1LS61_9HELO|nr:related to P.glauca late embryogenesis abundant protein and YBR177c and YPL095c [Rhynchosporium commune]
MEWLGHASISFTNCATPLALAKKDGTATDLLSICEESTPRCQLNPLLFNGHVQTMWTAIKNDGPPIYYKRKLFENEDPAYNGSFAVDFVVPDNTEVDNTLPIRTTYFSEEDFKGIESLDNRPVLVVLHGLSGGSYEIYLKHVLAPLVAAQGERQWAACVINSRGCAMHKITSSILYNARATWDCRQTVKWLRKTFPNRPLFGAGFSLGANILTNYIGEEGAACELKAAVICSNPWNLDAGSLALQRTWLGREIYSKTMGSNMKRLIELHHDEAAKNPALDFEKIRNVKYLHEFDREVQGPTWGYPTEGAYYRDASSTDSLFAIRIPLFAINAKDDPIAVDEALPYLEVKQTPYAILCTTSLGGHLSWFEIGGHRWHARPCVNFLNKMAFEINVDNIVDCAKDLPSKDHFSHSRFRPMHRKWANE